MHTPCGMQQNIFGTALIELLNQDSDNIQNMCLDKFYRLETGEILIAAYSNCVNCEHKK